MAIKNRWLLVVLQLVPKLPLKLSHSKYAVISKEFVRMQTESSSWKIGEWNSFTGEVFVNQIAALVFSSLSGIK